MVDTISDKLLTVIEDLRKEVASLSARVATLEQPAASAVPAAPIAAPVAPVAPAEPAPMPEVEAGITPEELLAISAAVAAYLGVRVRVRAIRLVSSRAWAQQGRVSIQASHRLHT
jgi:methylmalonyl-CoA carboxyltransferase large subunit